MAVPAGGAEPALERHVVIAGYGRVGRAIGAMLEEVGIPFVALDLDPVRVAAAQQAGRKVFYGDASDPRLLERAGTDRAAAAVITLDQPAAAERIVATLRSFYPKVAIVARAHDLLGRRRLEQLGAGIVVPETLELSLALGAAVLQRLGVAETAARDAADLLRREQGGSPA
jgi:CPA2 family monovalent cation:H+ antiporter-2